MKEFKKCKGIGKAKKFEGCGKDVNALTRKHGLCLKCYASWLYSTDEGLQKLQRAKINAVSERKKAQQDLANYKAERSGEKSLSWLKNNVKNVCHEYIRERDKYKPCVSCGAKWNDEFQAGHWKKAELFSSVKYHENNIHSQCKGCNLFKDGNVQEYDIRIKERLTDEEIKEINDLITEEKRSGFKWDRLKLEEKRQYYREKLKELKQKE
jgi:hypothetical protein